MVNSYNSITNTVLIFVLCELALIILILYFFFSQEIFFIYYSFFGKKTDMDKNFIDKIQKIKKYKLECNDENYLIIKDLNLQVKYLDGNPIKFKDNEECKKILDKINNQNM